MAKRAKPRQPPAWLLSVDPAEAAGFCLFHEGRPMLWGKADGSTWRGLIAELPAVQRHLALSEAPRECVIEDGFFQFGRQTFKGTLTLGRRRGLAQAAAEWCGFDKFTFVGPSTWQNALGYRAGQGKTTKEWSLDWVTTRWGINDITHDTADAIALGTYYLDTYTRIGV